MATPTSAILREVIRGWQSFMSFTTGGFTAARGGV